MLFAANFGENKKDQQNYSSLFCMIFMSNNLLDTHIID
jgi:hypothetical protein